MEEDNWIHLLLKRVILRDNSDQQWIYLQERDGKRGFPILIGTVEAQEIHRVVTGIETPRPLTHALAHGAIEALGASLEGVDIFDIREETFYAHLVLSRPEGGLSLVDARPSDALALGLRAGCPIRVAESVLEQVRTDKQGPDPMAGEAGPDVPSGPQGPGPAPPF